MRVIKGMSLGTYYAKGAVAARGTPNASAMRGLIYAVKDNREPPNPAQLVNHLMHPARHVVLVDHNNAIGYVTAIVARYRARIAEFFEATPSAITLVPVPSSKVTAATIETARFPTLKLCRALEVVGLGRVRVLAVQKEPVEAKTTGNRRTVEQILDGLASAATVYAMMPSALQLFAEGRLPRVGDSPVEVGIGGRTLGPMVLTEVRCAGASGRHDIAVLVFRRAGAAARVPGSS